MLEKTTNFSITTTSNFVTKGNDLYRQGQYAQAIGYYDKVLVTDTSYKEVWNNKGYALHKLGRYSEAIECYAKAIAIDENFKAAWENKGTALHNLGRYSERD